MNIDDTKLESILLREHYLSEDDIRQAREAISNNDESLVEYLLNQRYINKDLIGQAIAESFNVSYADLNSVLPTLEQVQRIPEEVAKKYTAVFFSEEGNIITIATDQPENPELLPELKKIFVQEDLRLAYSFSDDIVAGFVHYLKPLETRFSKIIENKGRIAPELLEEIFDDAISYHVSDIHFEPRVQDVLVRFRIDGVLHEAGRILREYYENILNRIKVQSGLRIDEHFSTQDGSFQYVRNDIRTDFRISFVPTVEGEKVVLRLLTAYVQGFSLSDLGLSWEHQQLLSEAARKPFGMILVTGPTGSGKTTTLYAFLKIINTPGVNITSIEDPVEYKMVGVNQIQTNAQTGLNFAKGLRSIVRQDPDIILVGEIRDRETAEIAVNAALTGHLLYSTFHANDAATAIPRLLEMGIEPFLLASTLDVIVAQRLVRKICEQCKYTVMKGSQDFDAPPLKAFKRYFKNESVTVYEGKKCEACGHTGYRGRTAIFECIKMTTAMQSLLLRNPSTKEIWELARNEGSKTLFEDGIEKVRSGITTIEELLRVAEPPKD